MTVVSLLTFRCRGCGVRFQDWDDETDPQCPSCGASDPEWLKAAAPKRSALAAPALVSERTRNASREYTELADSFGLTNTVTERGKPATPPPKASPYHASWGGPEYQGLKVKVGGKPGEAPGGKGIDWAPRPQK